MISTPGDPSLQPMFGIMPRSGTTAEIRWHAVPGAMIAHFMNAWSEGDKVFVDGFAAPGNSFAFFKDVNGNATPNAVGESCLTRLAFDLARTDGSTGFHPFAGAIGEMPKFDDRQAMQRYRYGWHKTADGIAMVDWQTGTRRGAPAARDRQSRHGAGIGIRAALRPTPPKATVTSSPWSIACAKTSRSCMCSIRGIGSGSRWRGVAAAFQPADEFPRLLRPRARARSCRAESVSTRSRAPDSPRQDRCGGPACVGQSDPSNSSWGPQARWYESAATRIEPMTANEKLPKIEWGPGQTQHGEESRTQQARHVEVVHIDPVADTAEIPQRR